MVPIDRWAMASSSLPLTQQILSLIIYLSIIAPTFGVELPKISELSDRDANPFEWEVSGYLMLDTDEYRQTLSDATEVDESESEIRRLRSELSFSILNWEGEVQFQFEDDADVQDANLTYKGFDGLDLKIGRMKIPTGMENDLSSRHLTLIERSVASEQTSLGRGNGLLLESGSKQYGWKLGFFDNSDWNDEVQDTALRVYWSPINKKKRQLHLGFHGSVRDWKNGGYRLRSNGELNTTDSEVVSPSLHPKKIHQNGIELAYQQWGVIAQLEYTHQDIQVQPSINESNTEYQFLQYQIAWLPFGQHRRYREGLFKRVSGKSGLTKIEFVVRQSEVDGFDNNAGSLIDTSSIGINWYCYKDTKLMVNYIETELERPASLTQQDTSGWSARLQWEFEL